MRFVSLTVLIVSMFAASANAQCDPCAAQAAAVVAAQAALAQAQATAVIDHAGLDGQSAVCSGWNMVLQSLYDQEDFDWNNGAGEQEMGEDASAIAQATILADQADEIWGIISYQCGLDDEAVAMAQFNVNMAQQTLEDCLSADPPPCP